MSAFVCWPREISLAVCNLFLVREYNKSGRKDDFPLRCKDPMLVNEYQLEIFPVLDVNKNDFKAVTKVSAKVDSVFLSNICLGDEKLLGY